MGVLEYDELVKLLNNLPNDVNLKNKIAKMVAEEVDEYVPYDTGELARSVKAEGGQIVYTAPYAPIVHEGVSHGKKMSFSALKHPKATDHWVDVGASAKSTVIFSKAKEIITKHLEGG